MGFSHQPAYDFWIIIAAVMKPLMTTNIQKSLANLSLVAMWANPWMVEDWRNSFTTFIAYIQARLSLVERLESFIVMLRQLSYAIKNQLKAPNKVPY